MKLSDVDIKHRLAAGGLEIEPSIPEANFGSLSIDLRLSGHFKVFRPTQTPFIDLGAVDGEFAMSDSAMEEVFVVDGGAFYLHPGELALGVTLERLVIPDDLVGWLDGRSSLARLGLGQK